MNFNGASTNLQPSVSSLKDLKFKLLLEARNPHGYKLLHQKLEERKSDDIHMIYTSFKGNIGLLMLDEFGSFVIQKLFDICNEEQMNQMVFSIAADLKLLMCLCCDSQGSRSMMKFVEFLSTPKQLYSMIFAFQKILIELVTHPIGSCVVGHFYQLIFHQPAHMAEQIVGKIADHFLHVATNESGSRIMQLLILDVCDLFGQGRLLAGIRVNLFVLCINQFGNHVVQHVIELGMPNMMRFITCELSQAWLMLSRNKYGSNVEKKLIEASKETYAPEIITEIINHPHSSRLLQNPYGSHVLQFAKEYSTGTVRETLDHLLLGDFGSCSN